jgi:hypothetical protein
MDHVHEVDSTHPAIADGKTPNVLRNRREEEDVVSQRRVCPQCGKTFKPAGLVGHLYHIHGVGRRDLLAVSQAAVVDASGAAERVIHLIDRLKEIREKRDELNTMDESYTRFLSSGYTDKTVKALKKSIDFIESEIIRELKILGVSVDEGT